MSTSARRTVRLKGGKVVSVNQREYDALKRRGDLDTGSGTPKSGDFERAHPRARKGSRLGGQFIRSGASGDAVRAVQRKVATNPDGQFGAQTTAAVRRFQQQHGLTVDGVVGQQTAAALLGNRNASKIAVGALTAEQRRRLAERGKPKPSRSRSRRRRQRLVEAVAIGSFLDRVKQLEPGETARLPDGGGVKHFMTEDGREAWMAGSPAPYRDGGLSWYGETRRTPEEAVSDAFTASAGRTDPESLGGTTAFYRYSAITVNGQPAELVRVDSDGNPVVRVVPAIVQADAERYLPRPEQSASWSALTRRPR